MKNMTSILLLLLSLFCLFSASAEESDTLTVANVRLTAPEGWHFEPVPDEDERCLTDGKTHLYLNLSVQAPELYSASAKVQWTSIPEKDCAAFSFGAGEIHTGENKAWTESAFVNGSNARGMVNLFWADTYARFIITSSVPTVPPDETVPAEADFRALVHSLAESAELTRPRPLLGLWNVRPGITTDLCFMYLDSSKVLANAAPVKETEQGFAIGDVMIRGETFSLDILAKDFENEKLVTGMRLTKDSGSEEETLRVFFLLLDMMEKSFGPCTDYFLMNNRDVFALPAGADGLTDRELLRLFIQSFPNVEISFRCVWDNLWLRGTLYSGTGLREGEIVISEEDSCSLHYPRPPFTSDKTGVQSF